MTTFCKFYIAPGSLKSAWGWNVFLCGTVPNSVLREIKKEKKRKAMLLRKGRYIPDGCKIEPNQEMNVKFSKRLWDDIIGEGWLWTHYKYKTGSYKFILKYEWKNAAEPANLESDSFFVAFPESKD